MKTEREWPGCGTAKNSDGTVEVVVVGGQGTGRFTFEIYEPDTELWRYDYLE